MERFFFIKDKTGDRFLCVMSSKTPVANPRMYRMDRMPHERLIDLMADAAMDELHDATRSAVFHVTGRLAPW